MRIMPRWASGRCRNASPYALTPSSHNALCKCSSLEQVMTGSTRFKLHHVSSLLLLSPAVPKQYEKQKVLGQGEQERFDSDTM